LFKELNKIADQLFKEAVTFNNSHYLKTLFNKFSLCHIYRERNEEADQLSKAGLLQDQDSWEIEEIIQGQSVRSNQPPYDQ